MPADPVLGRLEALAIEYRLPPAWTPRMRVLLDELANERSSITTVRDPEDGVERHIADSLTGLQVAPLADAATIADLGSGGGLPGLVLAAALPTAQVALVESVSRKCAFLRRVVGLAGIDNVTVVCERAEEWDAGAGGQDVVTARALAPLATLVEYGAPLLVDGGHLLAWKGAPDPAEVAAGDAAATIVGLERAQIVDLGVARTLYLYRKIAPTPPRFPRRSGVARKRPLAP